MGRFCYGPICSDIETDIICPPSDGGNYIAERVRSLTGSLSKYKHRTFDIGNADINACC